MNHDARVALSPPVPSSSAADHAQGSRRIFLGPLPYRVNGVEHDDSEAIDFVRQHGLRIFLQQGGRIEEWTEAKAKEYKERLKDRIVESTAWHAVTGSKKGRGKKKSMVQTVEWRGDTFEIGKVAGVSVNMLATPEIQDNVYSPQDKQWNADRSIRRTKSVATVHWDEPGKTSFVTARPTFSGLGSPGSADSPSLQASQGVTIGPRVSDSSEETHDGRNDVNESTSSKTPLFSYAASHPVLDSVQTAKLRGAKSDGDLPKRAKTGLKSILTISPGKEKGKGKAVRYVEVPNAGAPSGSQRPLPPEEVLRRSPTEVEGSSAAAAAEAVALESNAVAKDGDVDRGAGFMRDRMLVRVFRCDHGSLKSPFVEQDFRITRGLDNKEWGEFLVVWRNQRIELYENYRTPWKEHILGHKHLAFAIPLNRKTKLSLFSSVDLSFCLICSPTPTKSSSDRGHRSIFHRSSQGLNVFVLKPKSRSRSLDWVWNLWVELGGTLPDFVEVGCPLVHSRVSIPIPHDGEGWKAVTRDYIVDQCNRAMEGSFAWRKVIQLPILNGRRLELCWRSDTKLDWVWLKDDVDGRKRNWEVLFGMAMNYLGAPTQLELHLASHYSNHVTIDDGKHLEEPPSIEGFVHAYKRKAQTRVQYYLSTHDGYLCVIQLEKVVPPPTPTDLKSFSKGEEEFREDEYIRLRAQVMNARWFWDLRNVLLVRRASFVIHQVRDASVQRHSQSSEPSNPDASPVTQTVNFPNEESELCRTDSDIGDEGGDAGLTAAVDKGRLKMHRSFELVLKNGRILRFETHSTKVTVEWVAHLRALVQYWSIRYRDDVLTEMNIRQSLGEDKVTVSGRYCKNGFRHLAPTPDVENASLYMDEYWNWCALEGCRPVVKSGRVFMKTKFRAQYKHAHLILIRGCLVHFRVTNDFSLHNHQIGRINLIDAYVCSGYCAALALPQEEWDPNAPPVAKLFPDGLETRDQAEDTLFMLWYRPHVNYAKGDFNKIPIPDMSSKHKVVIFRARSRLERDAWCWALNCEIEGLMRRTKERESRAREQGMPI